MRKEFGRAARHYRPGFFFFAAAPLVDRSGLDSQKPAARTLTQAKNHIRSELLHGLDELAALKFDREDGFLKPASMGNLAEDSCRDVVIELAIRPKTIEENARAGHFNWRGGRPGQTARFKSTWQAVVSRLIAGPPLLKGF
jgi:hypothetical protein